MVAADLIERARAGDGDAFRELTAPTAVVLVEGVSDQMAVETLAVRRGRDLRAEGVAVIPVGGAHAFGRNLRHFGPKKPQAGPIPRTHRWRGHDRGPACLRPARRRATPASAASADAPRP